MSAVLILNTSSWRVFNVPWEKNAASAAEALSIAARESTLLLEILNEFSPHANSGVDLALEFGMNNDPNTAPFSSDINLTLVTLASALLVWPLNTIPFLIKPLNLPKTCCCKDPVSTFKIVLVAE